MKSTMQANNSITRFIEYILESFGYESIKDSSDSLFGGLNTGTSIAIGGLAGTMATFLEEWVGLETKVYIALVALFLVEFGTGVAASVFIRKERFNSYKMGRIVVKIFVYTGLLILFNSFKQHLGIDVFHLDFNFFEWIYYIVLNLLILQLIISVFENLETLGWKEVGVFTRIFKKKLGDVSGKPKTDDGHDEEN